MVVMRVRVKDVRVNAHAQGDGEGSHLVDR